MAPECASSGSTDTCASIDSETKVINALLTAGAGAALGTSNAVYGPHILDAEYARVRDIHTSDLS